MLLRTVAESGSSIEASKDDVIHLDRFLDAVCVASCWQDALETRVEGREIVENTLRAGLIRVAIPPISGRDHQAESANKLATARTEQRRPLALSDLLDSAHVGAFVLLA